VRFHTGPLLAVGELVPVFANSASGGLVELALPAMSRRSS
jgi:hypothetical protein